MNEESHVTRLFLTAFTAFAMLAFVPAQAKAEEFTDAQKTELKKLFEEYLLENGESVLKSVNTYQAKIDEDDRKEASKQATTFAATLEKADLPTAGNPDGDITMVEFFDYNCGYCRKALQEIQTVLKDDKNLKVIFIDMPILSPESLEAAKWSLAAHKQGKYFEFHQLVMEHNGPKDDAALESIAKKVGLDVKKMKTDKDDKKIEETLKKNIQDAQDIGIRGTPGFIVGGELYPGFIPADQIKETIAKARKK